MPTPATFTIPGTVCTLVVGFYQCSLPVPMPIGSDLTQISTYDGSSNLLSQQVGPPLTVVAGTLNTLGTPFAPITLDANPSTITTTSGSGVSGSQPNFRINNNSVVTFILSQVDAGGTTFVPQPGLPTMTHAAATGTGASASISGSQLTLTPASSGRLTYAVVEADPAGTQDVTTTLTSPSTMGATSFTVASASGIYPGANLILDYETYSGSTFLQESALVTNVSGTTITVASGLTHAHSSGAGVEHFSDNLVSSADPFTVTISPVLIVPIGQNSGVWKALAYNSSYSLQAGNLTSSTEEFDMTQFDANDNLYILDAYTAYTIYRYTYTPGTGFGSVTTYSGIPNVSSQQYLDFDVSGNGTVAVENSSVTPELTIFPAGTSSSPTNFTSSLDSTIWNTVVGYPNEPSVAVLTDGSSNVFGYAFDVYTLDASATDEIVVTNGSSEQDLSSSSIISEYNRDPQESMLTWDQGRQSLIFVNNGMDMSGNHPILEFPRNGTTGASLQSTATTIGTVAGTPYAVAASEDGSSVAVGWRNGSGTGFNVSIFHNNGSGWTLASSGSSLASTTFSNLAAVHFLANGNLAVTDGQNLQQFTGVGASFGPSYNLINDFGGGYYINDFAASL
jgi:hypothetical protein